MFPKRLCVVTMLVPLPPSARITLVTAAMPDATAMVACAPARAVTLRSRSSTVGLELREYVCATRRPSKASWMDSESPNSKAAES